jgi:hypothetical protein
MPFWHKKFVYKNTKNREQLYFGQVHKKQFVASPSLSERKSLNGAIADG